MQRVAFVIAAAACLATSASADPRPFASPPLLKSGPTLDKDERASHPSEVEFSLDIRYTDGRIWDPSRSRFDAVRLRSYQGTGVDPNVPYVSPTIEIFPGETIRITLNNRLPKDDTCLASHHGDVNTPHCFNGTNLHTHGLWVNPAGNGDNVLISINPGVSFQYEYKLPPDHPAGTFWYHSHRHGSTAMQVSSGMAGALIVRGTRPPTDSDTGDIDTLLTPTRSQRFTERVLVFQQIQYACRTADGTIKTNADGSYRCDPGDVGGIEGYDQLGFGQWPRSGRHTAINGQVLPVFQGGRAGEIERWRMIHGGVRDTINLQFRKLNGPTPLPANLDDLQAATDLSQGCTGETLPQHVIAADGLTLKSAMKMPVVVFQPAYRWDSLLVFPEPGVYCVIDDAEVAEGNIDNIPSSRQLLGLVVVDQGLTITGDIGHYITEQLAFIAGVNLPGSVAERVAGDLRNGFKLTSFVPHPDIADDEVTGTQEISFNITPGVAQFHIDDRSYDPARMDRVLTLGGVDEWTMHSWFASHPFHIHINPFQIVKILDPNGRDVSAPGAVDNAGSGVDPQYSGLKGVWKDTLWVKNIDPAGGPPGAYTIVVRTRYQRYIGDFVLHCHILDHEDKGMMQNVRIALPDGAGGTVSGHH